MHDASLRTLDRDTVCPRQACCVDRPGSMNSPTRRWVNRRVVDGYHVRKMEYCETVVGSRHINSESRMRETLPKFCWFTGSLWAYLRVENPCNQPVRTDAPSMGHLQETSMDSVSKCMYLALATVTVAFDHGMMQVKSQRAHRHRRDNGETLQPPSIPPSRS